MRTLSAASLCCLLLGCQGLQEGPSEPLGNIQSLTAVQSIYIEDLGHDEGAELVEETGSVRERISTGLVKSGRFSVVQDPQQADAILTGLVGIERWYHGLEGYYGMEGDLDDHELGIGNVRLVDSRTKQPIWTHKYQPGLLTPTQSVAERVADQVVDKLLHDASHKGRDQPNQPQ